MYIPKLRRINDVIKEIRAADEQAEISWYLIQHLIKTGKLTAMKFGNSWLINLDELYCFFRAKEYEE
jgi:hypothetical protein